MYTEKFNHLVPMAAPGTISLTTSGSIATPTYAVGSQCQLNRIGLVLTTATSGGTVASVQFIFRPTPGSATNQVVLGTINVPDGTAIGKCVYKDITDVGNILIPGGQLVFNVSAQDTAGAAVAVFEVCDSPANAKALTSMIASS